MSTIQKNSNWLYISPVYHLEISKDLKGELSVGRVIFVEANKLARIRKRIGLPIVLSKIDKKIPDVNFFKESKTFAIIQFKGVPEQKEFECRELIENAINLISSSQLGYCARDNNSQFGIIKTRGTGKRFFINKNIFEANLNSYSENKVLPFRLDKRWKEFHKDFYFFDLLKLISSNNKIQKKWKETIIRAATMSGKSMQSRDIEYSFLWNMIIVEMLLTEQGDKYSESLPERAEAFIGWVGYWEENKFEEKIRSLYTKRSQFVHDGNSNNITVEDVLFTDDLVFNLLWNIIKHIDLFPSKASVITFSEKVQAEKLLKVKPKVQPKTLKFMNRNYDINRIKRI
ncbi:MAG TPA: hypothetical protein DER09_01510 [Prolixibacteraceae bacterium]|nr:hypothetical protein [Prolixibacteraceae bacterium]